MNILSLKEKFASLLNDLNPNWENDSDMKDTPLRLANMYTHFFRNEDVKIHFEKKFPSKNNNIVVIKDIECIGMCPHHLLPIIYKVDIGYIPNGYVLGLSKFVRIARALSSYPKLQENFTIEIASNINKYLSTKGVIVYVNGIHGCMRCRGVEQNASTITMDIKGIFNTNYDLIREFNKFID